MNTLQTLKHSRQRTDTNKNFIKARMEASSLMNVRYFHKINYVICTRLWGGGKFSRIKLSPLMLHDCRLIITQEAGQS